jgi:hypothetical protein
MLVKPRVIALGLVTVLIARPGQLLPKPIEIGLR